MGCQRGSVPRLQSTVAHPQAVHDTRRVSVVRVAHRKEFVCSEGFKGERRHPCCCFAGQALPPEVGVQAPPYFQRVAAQYLQISGDVGVAPEVLNAACSCYSAALQFDERPPAGSQSSPAPLNARNSGRSLLARLGLPAEKAHHFGPLSHLVQTLEMLRAEGF